MGKIKSAKMGKVIAVSISEQKGTRKHNVDRAKVIENFGIENDAHAGMKKRQVSLLAMESINKMKEKGIEVNPGDFAENITTSGIELHNLPVGTLLKIGDTLLEVSQIGKKCHQHCEIFKLVGDCVMPREGIFAKVLKGGEISPGDPVEIIFR